MICQEDLHQHLHTLMTALPAHTYALTKLMRSNTCDGVKSQPIYILRTSHLGSSTTNMFSPVMTQAMTRLSITITCTAKLNSERASCIYEAILTPHYDSHIQKVV